MPITIDGNGTIGGASTLSTTVASPTFTTPNINSAQFATVTGTAPLYAARAWVNFNGTGTVAIRASGNVSSITDNGTGDYTVSFTIAMPDASYCVAGIAAASTTKADLCGGASATPYTTTTARILTSAGGGPTAMTDPENVSIAIFR